MTPQFLSGHHVTMVLVRLSVVVQKWEEARTVAAIVVAAVEAEDSSAVS